MFTKKERKAAKYFYDFIEGAQWIQKSISGKVYLVDNNNEIICSINNSKFKNISEGQTWSLKTILEGKVK